MIAKVFAERGKLQDSVLTISGSKSESNRLLVLNALYNEFSISNVSNSDDSRVLMAALNQGEGEIDIHHAGTAMRFLTAYYAAKKGAEVILTGSDRMKERPISILVDALRDLGASIDYLGSTGYPPLSINGKDLEGGIVDVQAGTSSQYITALLLIAPTLRNGLKLELKGEVTSGPYIEMTLQLLKKIGVELTSKGNRIEIKPLVSSKNVNMVVESDWSSASYFYSLVALTEGLNLTLKHYHNYSLQGDSELAKIYEKLGVETIYNQDEHSIQLRRFNNILPGRLRLNLNATPDIAQTLVVTCLGLKLPCEFTGLHTLRIKETDRLSALKNEIGKLGTTVEITDDSLVMSSPETLTENVIINTYNDHRMAMAFAPLGLLGHIKIDDPEVVSKSFPDFWEKLTQLGFEIIFER